MATIVRPNRSDADGPADATAQTTDDTAAGWGERTDEPSHEQWLREQRPPHWD
jgi:hypothetical protein